MGLSSTETWDQASTRLQVSTALSSINSAGLIEAQQSFLMAGVCVRLALGEFK